jgi:hypothetical protein
MIIQALKVVLEEAEVAARVRDALGGVSQLRDVTFGLAPGTVKIGGTFQVGLAVPFETQWSVEVLEAGRKLGVKLSNVSVGFFGMSAAAVSGQVMGALAQKLQGVPGAAVEGDVIVLEPAVLLAAKGIRLEAPVRRLAVLAGRVEVELGA